VSRRIGIKPNAVAALAYRARKGLREAYLQAHLKAEASEECRATVSRLGNYVRGDLAEKDRIAVQTHLDACAKCRCRRDELTDVNATLRNAFLPVPLLLAGLQRKAFSFGHVAGQWMDRAPDISQTAPLADNPLVHKALAGITMMVLALSGSATPTITHHADQPALVAAADPSAVGSAAGAAASGTASEVPSVAAPPDVPARPEAPAAAAAPAPVTASAAAAGTDEPAYRDLQGANHSTLLFSGRDDSSPNYPGGTRSSIIHRPVGSSGGLLDDTPVGAALDSVVSAVSQAVPLPVDVGLSLPGVTGPLDAPLSATAQLPGGQSVAVQVPPLITGVLGGVLKPVSDALSGLTAGLTAGH
jgi:anti-sigma factor RsiW